MIFRNFQFPWFSALALLFLCWLLVGCSAVKIKACLPGAAECTTYNSRGKSALENPELIYERELPDGTVLRLRFNADSTNREGNTVDQAIAQAIVERLFQTTIGN